MADRDPTAEPDDAEPYDCPSCPGAPLVHLDATDERTLRLRVLESAVECSGGDEARATATFERFMALVDDLPTTRH